MDIDAKSLKTDFMSLIWQILLQPRGSAKQQKKAEKDSTDCWLSTDIRE